MNDYLNLLKFWNDTFQNIEEYKVDGKFVQSEKLNTIFKKYINSDSNVLDFGCGSGWGIFEIYLTSKFSNGVGIDPSINSIKLANKCNELSGFNNIQFINGNHETLSDYQNTFDFIFSTNVIDVLPNEITYEILDSLKKSLKKNGYLLICLNPFFTEQELTEVLKMEKKESYYYKNNILRCNYKTVNEWEKIFEKYFSLLESSPFKLMDNDKYERRMYFLKNNK